jgi:hypothetical protein
MFESPEVPSRMSSRHASTVHSRLLTYINHAHAYSLLPNTTAMRTALARLARRISRSLHHSEARRHSAVAPYTAILGSQDRLVVAHPGPTMTTSDKDKREGTRMPACKLCARRVEGHEVLQDAPSVHCAHEGGICRYCLHNLVYLVFKKSGGWNRVRCPECQEGLREEEARGLVLLWGEIEG